MKDSIYNLFGLLIFFFVRKFIFIGSLSILFKFQELFHFSSKCVTTPQKHRILLKQNETCKIDKFIGSKSFLRIIQVVSVLVVVVVVVYSVYTPTVHAMHKRPSEITLDNKISNFPSYGLEMVVVEVHCVDWMYHKNRVYYKFPIPFPFPFIYRFHLSKIISMKGHGFTAMFAFRLYHQ